VSRVLSPFAYIEPMTIDEATNALSKHGPGAKVLAGGCDLIPSMLRSEIKPKCIVSIHKISELDFIKSAENGLRFGALSTIRSLELSSEIRQCYPVLHEALRSIKKIQVKTSGTIVGNLCVASSASDLIPTLLILQAKLKVIGPETTRTIALVDFCVGGKQCSLLPDEIVTEVFLPKVPSRAGGAFLKLTRTTADIAKVNVAVLMEGAGDVCKEAKIALGAVATAPIRIKTVEAMLKGQRITSNLIAASVEALTKEIKPISDIRSTAEYRIEAAKVLVEKALKTAAGRMNHST
jgi:carbon-monoxide dehydrogenase medium subunit